MIEGSAHNALLVIEQVLGVSAADVRSRSKKSEHSTARVLFIGLMEKVPGFRSKDAAKFLGRSTRDVNHLRDNHRKWFTFDRRYNRLFIECCTQYLNDGFQLLEYQRDLIKRIADDTALLEQVEAKLKQLRNE
jgi:hypothetical protein